jgi:hypothetical protein
LIFYDCQNGIIPLSSLPETSNNIIRRIPMSRLTDMQLVILSAASQRDYRGVELPANVKCEAARKAADKLIRAGLRPQRRFTFWVPRLARLA